MWGCGGVGKKNYNVMSEEQKTQGLPRDKIDSSNYTHISNQRRPSKYTGEQLSDAAGILLFGFPGGYLRGSAFSCLSILENAGKGFWLFRKIQEKDSHGHFYAVPLPPPILREDYVL